MINRTLIIDELEYVGFEKRKNELLKLTDSELAKCFNEYCELNCVDISILDIFESFADVMICIDTPDGWQTVGDFFIKKTKPIYEITLANNSSAKVASTHLFEHPGGWIMAKNLTTNHALLTKDGYSKIKSIIVSEESEGYDLEINHENHRYWSGGISSHNSGKTFLCLNSVRELQNMGYFVFYIDTEGAIDSYDFPKFGANLEQLKYYRMKMITDVKFFVDGLVKQKKESPDIKIALFVDSIGLLNSDKEVNDFEKGKSASDMGLKAKDLRAMFRSFTLDLSNERIPFIFTNHTYCLTADHLIEMEDSSFMKIQDIAIGDRVKTMDGPKPVTNVFSFENQKVRKITLDNGQSIECTDNHKFLTEDTSGTLIWKKATDLQENDKILSFDSKTSDI